MNYTMIRLLSMIIILGFSLAASEVALKKEDTTAAAKAPVAITEVSMADVEAALANKVTVVVDASGSGDIIEGALRIAANADNGVITANLKDKNAEIIIYCGGPRCPSSMTLAYRLVDLGYTNVKHYAGGISEWKEKNKPIATPAK